MSPPIGGVRAGYLSAGKDAIPDSGVSRWTFDDADTSGTTAIDSWGNNDGTINGATTGVSGANQTYDTNEAYSFDGTDDYVQTSSTTDFDLTSFSLSVWIYQDTTYSTNRGAVYRANFSDDASSPTIDIFARGDGSSYTFNVGDGNSFNEITIGGQESGRWIHLVVTYDGDTAIFYMDGESKNSGTFNVTPNQNGKEILIGARYNRYWDGDLDDVRVYDKALSSTEVSNLYNTGSIDG